MTLRRRVLSGGIALGFVLTGWGMTGGATAPAEAACTPLAGNYALCIDNYKSPGSTWNSVVLADTVTGAGTGVALACDVHYGVALLYAANAVTFDAVQLGKGAAETILCP